jgi:hypothetical protein
MICDKERVIITRKLPFIYLSILLLIASVSVVSGQEEKQEAPSIKDRLFYGGSLGLQFGSITDIQVAPIVGFWILPRINVAVGPDYRYYKDRTVATSLYGGKAYVQFVVIQDLNSFLPMGSHTGIFLHLEDELLSLKSSFWKFPLPYTSDRFYVNTVLAGGGISQQIGRKASLNFIILWPINDSVYPIYGKPELRISFTF